MARRTRIVATLGPASSEPAVIAALIDAGVDVVRLGLAHGPVEDHIEVVRRVRAAAEAAGRNIGVLADLPGPKIRAVAFPEGGVFLVEGEPVTLLSSSHANATGESTAERIEVGHDALLDELEPGDRVTLGDGGSELRVGKMGADTVAATVVSGGRLQGRPGVGLPPERLRLTTPTAEDLVLLDAMVAEGVDMIAVSFVNAAADVEKVRAAAGTEGPMLVAKIETAAAVSDLDAIVGTADAVMVARGDLGLRVAAEDVPHVQKRIIRSCISSGRPVITATQMLESMVNAPTPTRAEVSDVANAVLDGTDALMLSGETAIGHDPVTAVTTMARIAERAERECDYPAWGKALGRLQTATAPHTSATVNITAAMSAAAWRATLDIDVTAVLCATRTGSTARAAARFRPTVPILAVTPSTRTAHQLAVTWGVEAVAVDERTSTDDIVWFAVAKAAELGLASSGDVIAVLAGSPTAPDPTTDVLRLVRVE